MALHLVFEEEKVLQVKTAQSLLQALVDLTEMRATPGEREHITIEAQALWVSLSHINDLLLSFTTLNPPGAKPCTVHN